jgi:murein DD-endopeptidase MepM/ murein hydrolase activator NlpD
VRREKNTAQQLREVEHEVALTADLLRTLESKQGRIELQLEGIRTEHEVASEELAEQKRRLGATLRAMYVRGQPRTAEVLLRTTNMRTALSHFKYLGIVARNNERLLEEIREQEAYLAATDARLTETLAEVAATAGETRAERERLTQARKTRQTTLQRVRQQRAEYKRALDNLSESEKKVQGFIGVLEKRRQAALAAGRAADVFPDVGFARLRGRMPWPVRGRVTGAFGRQTHPKHGTVTFNSGIDIAAAEGEPVRAVARGQVEYVKWLDGYGRTIILNHGAGFYTLYAHLSETAVGEAQPVEPGQVIGRVGDSGSLDGAKLHFAVWEKANPVDPRGWLGR